MFLHLGGDKIIPKKEIIAIMDYKKGNSNINKDFIKNAKDENLLINVSDSEKEKSYIITNDKVYVSSISCNTLKKRSREILISIDDY